MLVDIGVIGVVVGNCFKKTKRMRTQVSWIRSSWSLKEEAKCLQVFRRDYSNGNNAQKTNMVDMRNTSYHACHLHHRYGHLVVAAMRQHFHSCEEVGHWPIPRSPRQSQGEESSTWRANWLNNIMSPLMADGQDTLWSSEKSSPRRFCWTTIDNQMISWQIIGLIAGNVSAMVWSPQSEGIAGGS